MGMTHCGTSRTIPLQKILKSRNHGIGPAVLKRFGNGPLHAKAERRAAKAILCYIFNNSVIPSKLSYIIPILVVNFVPVEFPENRSVTGYQIIPLPYTDIASSPIPIFYHSKNTSPDFIIYNHTLFFYKKEH